MRKKTTDCGRREICPDAYDKLLMKYTAVCKERDELKAKLNAIQALVIRYEMRAMSDD